MQGRIAKGETGPSGVTYAVTVTNGGLAGKGATFISCALWNVSCWRFKCLICESVRLCTNWHFVGSAFVERANENRQQAASRDQTAA
jgi:hypothetical protein